jgi:hypothetical protein
MSTQKPEVPKIDFTPTVNVNREILGNDLAYFDYDESFYYQTKASLLRFLHPINPFSMPHESNERHVGKAHKSSQASPPETALSLSTKNITPTM